MDHVRADACSWAVAKLTCQAVASVLVSCWCCPGDRKFAKLACCFLMLRSTVTTSELGLQRKSLTRSMTWRRS